MLFLLVGCTEFEWEPYYSAELDNVAYCENNSAIPAVIKLSSKKQAEQTYLDFFKRGYCTLGIMEIPFGPLSDIKEQMQNFSKKVGASKILIWGESLGTSTGYLPIVTPNFQTTTFSGNVGTSSYSGVAHTYGGTNTTYVPYTIHHFVYHVCFLGKHRTKHKTGIYFDKLSDDDRRVLGSNNGVKVVAVIENSVAWENNITKGDILFSWNGFPILDSDDFTYLSSRGEKHIRIGILREDKIIYKEINFDKKAGVK